MAKIPNPVRDWFMEPEIRVTLPYWTFRVFPVVEEKEVKGRIKRGISEVPFHVSILAPDYGEAIGRLVNMVDTCPYKLIGHGYNIEEALLYA